MRSSFEEKEPKEGSVENDTGLKFEGLIMAQNIATFTKDWQSLDMLNTYGRLVSTFLNLMQLKRGLTKKLCRDIQLHDFGPKTWALEKDKF